MLRRIRTTFTSPSNRTTSVSPKIDSKLLGLTQIAHYGTPSYITSVAVDPVQSVMAVGTQIGDIKIFGRHGVEYLLSSSLEPSPIRFLEFIVNQGAVVSISESNVVSLWNLVTRRSESSFKLSFTPYCVCLIPDTPFMLLGSDKPNSIVAIDIEMSGPTKYVVSDIDSAVTSISLRPTNFSECLITANGHLLLYDIVNKLVLTEYSRDVGVLDSCWYYDGSKFLSGHTDGKIALWNAKGSSPKQIFTPIGDSSEESVSKIWFWTPNMVICQTDDVIVAVGPLGHPDCVRFAESKSASVYLLFGSPWPVEQTVPWALFSASVNGDLECYRIGGEGLSSMVGVPLPSTKITVTTSTVYSVPPDFLDDLKIIFKESEVGVLKTKHAREWPLRGGVVPESCGENTILIIGLDDGSVILYDVSARQPLLLSIIETKRYCNGSTSAVTCVVLNIQYRVVCVGRGDGVVLVFGFGYSERSVVPTVIPEEEQEKEEEEEEKEEVMGEEEEGEEKKDEGEKDQQPPPP